MQLWRLSMAPAPEEPLSLTVSIAQSFAPPPSLFLLLDLPSGGPNQPTRKERGGGAKDCAMETVRDSGSSGAGAIDRRHSCMGQLAAGQRPNREG
jgi:hypothetical protein